MHAKPGDRVRKGEPLLTLLSDDEDRFARAEEALAGGYDVSDSEDAHQAVDVVLDRIQAR
jgi:thymidine phosphorylase